MPERLRCMPIIRYENLCSLHSEMNPNKCAIRIAPAVINGTQITCAQSDSILPQVYVQAEYTISAVVPSFR